MKQTTWLLEHTQALHCSMRHQHPANPTGVAAILPRVPHKLGCFWDGAGTARPQNSSASAWLSLNTNQPWHESTLAQWPQPRLDLLSWLQKQRRIWAQGCSCILRRKEMPPAAPQPVGIALRRLRVALTLHREQQDTCGPKRNSKRGPSKHGPERNSRRGPTTHAPQGPQAQHVLPMGVANIESVREWGPLGATQVPLVLWVGG